MVKICLNCIVKNESKIIKRMLNQLKDIWIEYATVNRQRTFRQKINSLMFLNVYSCRLHHIFDIVMMGVILIAVLIVIIVK